MDPGAPVRLPVGVEASGTFATTSQLSLVDPPKLTPPWISVPAPGRMLELKSKPCQYSCCLP